MVKIISTEHISSSEEDSHAGGEVILHLLWNPKVQYQVHNSLPGSVYPEPSVSAHTHQSCSFVTIIDNVQKVTS
jgi:hypothetical protein